MNTLNQNNKIPLFQRMAEFFFIIYLITLYLFVDRDETLIISNIAFVLFAGCALFRIMQRKRIYIGKNMLTAYIAFTWMQATTFWASSTYLASDRMKTMWLLFVLFFITYNLFYEKEDAHEYLLKSFYIAGIALIGYSIKTYGISEVINMMTNESGVRLGKEINQENSFGMMNATTIIISFYYLLHKNRYRLFHIIVASGAFLYAMSSGSRKAMLMMCIGVLFLIYKKYGIKKLYKVIAVGTVAVLVFMAIIQLPMFEFISHRMEITIDAFMGEGEGDASSRLREKMIITGWDLFKDRMLTGYGANNFCIISGYRTYSHNNFIEMLVDFGLIGFILYYSIYLMSIGTLWKKKKTESQVILIILLIRIMMEMALVTYYSKLQWVILAFALLGEKAFNANTENPEAQEYKEFYGRDKEDFYEIENICVESEKSIYEPEACDTIPFEQGEYSTCFSGQAISQDEVSGNYGEET